ncbi:MAG TPA: alpha/beta hydrolase [Candidatus Binataceae bacterium]|nr:alpha/beta hydrolase [Candidatus Binataceae bacterium]
MPTFLLLTATACVEFTQQMAFLMADPVYYGSGVALGDGHPVLLIPGYFAGDWTFAPLAQWLRRIGYRPYYSGIEFNVGCPQSKLEMVRRRVAQISSETSRSVTIIGHSLGGVLGRAAATANPEAVRQVIAIGSPIRGGWVRNRWIGVHDEVRPVLHASQALWQLFYGSAEGCGTLECSCGFEGAGFAPFPKHSRFASIYSRSDEMARWQACVDEDSPSFEVGGRHVSLIVNPAVYRIMASLLAAGNDTQVAA